MLLWNLIIITSLVEIHYAFRMGSKRAPIILVPGLLGSKLSYISKEKKQECFRNICPSWKTLWFSAWEFIFRASFSRKFSLVYDKEKGEMVNAPGYNIRPPTFGEVKGIDYLSDIHLFSDYYSSMIDMLGKDLGYEPGVDLFGAAYDFRFISTPNHFEEYSNNLTVLIENSFRKLGTKVVLVTHSLGGPLIKRFLLSKSQEWKDAYVDLWFSINGAFAGSVTSIQASLVGQISIVPKIFQSSNYFKKIFRTFPSIYYLFPSEKIFGKDYVIVNLKGEPLTLSQMDKIMSFYGDELSPVLYKNKTEIWDDEVILGVKTYCFYSGGLKTIKSIGIDANFLRKAQYDGYGDGDGMVNIESLQSCKKFFSKEDEEIDVEYHEGINHLDAIKNRITLNRLKSLLYSL